MLRQFDRGDLLDAVRIRRNDNLRQRLAVLDKRQTESGHRPDRQ